MPRLESKLEREFLAKTKVSRRQKTFARRCRLWRLGLLAVIIMIAAGYIPPLRSLFVAGGQVASQQAETDRLQKQHDFLQQEKNRLQSNRYVEELARRDLGLVKPGEQSYVVRDLDRTPGRTEVSVPAPEENKSLADRILGDLKSLLP